MKPLLLAALLLCVDCATTPLDAAVNQANAAHAIALQVETVRDQLCTDGYRHALTPDAVSRLNVECLPIQQYLAEYKTAVRALSAATIAARLGMPTAVDAANMLVDRERDVAAAATRLAWALSMVGH